MASPHHSFVATLTATCFSEGLQVHACFPAASTAAEAAVRQAAALHSACMWGPVGRAAVWGCRLRCMRGVMSPNHRKKPRQLQQTECKAPSDGPPAEVLATQIRTSSGVNCTHGTHRWGGQQAVQRHRGQSDRTRRAVQPHVGVDGTAGEKLFLFWTSRRTQTGIGHSAPAHRGRLVQNRSRRREQRWGRQRTKP